MSHVAKVDLKFVNIPAMQRACQHIGANFCGKGIIKFYDETEVGGYVIQFPEWQYPIVIKSDGSLAYDNYEGEWGDLKYLNQFKQFYAAETAIQSAVENNYSYTAEELPTGVLKVTIEM